MKEILQEQPYKVLVRVDSAGRVLAINSSAFVQDASGWVEIDSGYGDRYHHAQGNYLPLPMINERGVYRYKLVDGKVAKRTQEEMDADYVPPVPAVSETDEALAELAYLAAENAARLDEQDAALVELAALLTEGGV